MTLTPNTAARRTLSIMAALLALGATMAMLYGMRGHLRSAVAYGNRWMQHYETPNVAWDSADPGAEGLDKARLEALRRDLERHDTEAFLVVRGNRIAYEWYAPDFGPNLQYGIAALAKALTGSTALLVALSDGRIDLDGPASEYIPAWRDDPVRSRIRIKHLAFHASGLDNVKFGEGKAGRLQGWKKDYYERPAERFTRAIHQAPVLFAPGSRYEYSGVGYYALAYAVTASLRGAPQQDIETLLRERIMQPLGIPRSDWRLSYGESYPVDGMKLYAFGSGASMTARAIARIGELVLDKGQWDGKTLLDPYWLSQLLGGGWIPPHRTGPDHPEPVPGGGWWLNVDGILPTVPRDAVVGIGGGDQCLLVVPSLDLVAVRLGTDLGEDGEDALYKHLFEPLMRAVVGPSSRADRAPYARDGHGT